MSFEAYQRFQSLIQSRTKQLFSFICFFILFFFSVLFCIISKRAQKMHYSSFTHCFIISLIFHFSTTLNSFLLNSFNCNLKQTSSFLQKSRQYSIQLRKTVNLNSNLNLFSSILIKSEIDKIKEFY